MKTSLYILTYNSPKQVLSVLRSFEQCDKKFITKTRKILIDNSTNLETKEDYDKIASEYGLEIIKKDNIGIASGRQFVAEHFEESDSDYYVFFEDDMHLVGPCDEKCSNGFGRYVSDLYDKSIAIVHGEQLDFLKLSYTEFFGDNGYQWAWYNIPADIRSKFFPGNDVLPEKFADPHVMPRTMIKERKKFQDLNYRIGDYHFCNWPLWFSRSGNYKLFLETVWQYPYEQTIMSQNFNLQKEGRMRCGVLELSPIHHERFDHYPAEERREVT